MALGGIGIIPILRRPPPGIGITPNAPTLTEWRGTTDGDPTDATNWTNGIPVDGGTAIFNSGSVDCDGGSGLAGVSPEKVLVHHGWQGSMTAALVFDSIGKVVVSKRNGTVRLGGAIQAAYIERGEGVAAFTVTAPDVFTLLVVAGGQATVDGGAAPTTLHVSTTEAARSVVDIDSTAGTTATLTATRYAYITTASAVTSAVLEQKARLLLEGAAALTAASCGDLSHLAHQSSADVVTGITLREAAIASFRDNDADAVDAGDCVLYSAGVLDLRAGAVQVTPTSVEDWGGVVLTDPGMVLTIA